jgi:hypothetical protein
MTCCICQKHLDDVGVLYRINAKGVPGIWACAKHIKQTDAHLDPDLQEISEVIAGKRAPPQEGS